jgi:hypothetical protein
LASRNVDPSLSHAPSRLRSTKLLTHVNNFSHHLKCQHRFAPTLFTSSERSIHIVGIGMGVVSPLLANVYLHYVFDLWVEAWRKKVATGDVIVVRYADDVVLGMPNDSCGIFRSGW